MFRHSSDYIKALLKWLVVAVLIGVLGGIIGSTFSLCITMVTGIREANKYIIFMLPVAGVLITFLYKMCAMFGKIDTNRIIRSAGGNEKVPVVMIPLIYISTVITHLVGGSAGREGAALQLGGCLGYSIGDLFKFKNDSIHTVVMAGMSAVFASVFGTPVTAAIFSIEVVCVGIMHYSALVPCLISAVVAYGISLIFGIKPEAFSFITFEGLSVALVTKAIVLALLCAVVSILFCFSIRMSERYMKKLVPNSYLRAALGGVAIIALTVVFGCDYNGAGMHIVEQAMHGNARAEAFILKILFTAITIGSGFKGGEIVPAFFVGSTFGCVVGSLIGLDAGIGAAIGFVALFCGVVNCPLASIMLSVEIFGSQGFAVFAIVCAVSYMMSGRYGLYKSQKIVFSKLDEHKINANSI